MESKIKCQVCNKKIAIYFGRDSMSWNYTIDLGFCEDCIPRRPCSCLMKPISGLCKNILSEKKIYFKYSNSYHRIVDFDNIQYKREKNSVMFIILKDDKIPVCTCNYKHLLDGITNESELFDSIIFTEPINSDTPYRITTSYRITNSVAYSEITSSNIHLLDSPLPF